VGVIYGPAGAPIRSACGKKGSNSWRRGCLLAPVLTALLLASPRPGRAAEPELAARDTAEAPPVLLLEAARQRRRSDLVGAQRDLLQALERWPGEPAILKELGDLLLDRCLARDGTHCFEEALRRDPDDLDALRGLARAQLRSRDFTRARSLLDMGLARWPADPELLATRAKILVHERSYDEALRLLDRARPADHSQVHSARATILFRKGDMEGSREELLETLRLEPDNVFAHHRLGTGSSVLTPPLPPGSRARLDSLIGEAGRLLEAGRYEETRDLLLASIPEFELQHKVHHLLALALTEIDFSRHALSSLPEFRSLFASLPDPPVPDVDGIIVNFPSLSGEEQKAVRLALAPLQRFLPALKRAGATHEILALTTDIVDLPQFRHLHDRTTFDRRYYAHVRGLGGLHAATGREYLHESSDFRYNTLAHEFAHQVHLHALDGEAREELDALYADALRGERALDYYARSDVAEYFAQGYEAYVSPFKRPCLSATAGHTRDELRAKDPALYGFIVRLTGGSGAIAPPGSRAGGLLDSIRTWLDKDPSPRASRDSVAAGD